MKSKQGKEVVCVVDHPGHYVEMEHRTEYDNGTIHYHGDNGARLTVEEGAELIVRGAGFKRG